MKKISLNIISLLLATMLTACATDDTTTATNDNSKQTPAIASSASTLGEGDAEASEPVPTIQAKNTVLETSDAGIGSTSIGGAVEQAMDEADRTKMLHAMDKAPGKSTSWTNVNTDIEYTVTPIKKVAVEGKSYCRAYQMTAVDANNREQKMQGVACIAADGNWHTMQS